MSCYDLHMLVGPILCIVGSILGWINAADNSRSKTWWVIPVILGVLGIIITEINLHYTQGTRIG